MKFKRLKVLLLILSLITAHFMSYGNSAYAEPIEREVNAEIIAGFDFTVYHQQGSEFLFKFNDHSADFSSRSNNPAKFNFNIQTTREGIEACSVHFITWQQQETEVENAQRVAAGRSLDRSFKPGLAGVVSSDKTIHTGENGFTVARSTMTADFFGATKGDPFNPNIAEEILSSLSSYERALNFPKLDDYPFQEYFTTVGPNKNLAWMTISGAWGDDRYVVYSLPCASIITLPALDETAPTVTFSPNTLAVRSASSGTSTLKVTDNVGLSGSTKVECTNGGRFSRSTFRAPTVTKNTTSVCTASASDAAGNTATGTLTVAIRPKTPPKPNKPPVATDDSGVITLPLNSLAQFSPLQNDKDPDGDPLTITDILSVDSGLSVELIDDRNVRVKSLGSYGIKTFTYQISDGRGGFDEGIVSVNIPDETRPNELTECPTAAGCPTLKCPNAPDCPKEPTIIKKLIIGTIALLALAGVVFAALMKRRTGAAKLKSQPTGMAPIRPFKFNRSMLAQPEKPGQNGVVFANSPLVAGAATAGPAPLAPLGQMVPSGLQTLTGQYAVLKPAYMATGRIGGPQEGVPTNDDVAFGTGFLITPNHIMTNQHVYEFYKHYLTGADCGGIEFIAERDCDASDYVAFNGEPPVIIPDLDIAIFTLARSVTDRKPIERVAIPTDALDAREVVTISYPCPFEVDDAILAVVEKDPIFAVKRLSQGHVFKHSTDTDTPYGVAVKVDATINPAESLLAICHNASTLGGSSGAPILDMGGKLVGVHFAGDRAFNGQEAANLAMAIEMLVNAHPKTETA